MTVRELVEVLKGIEDQDSKIVVRHFDMDEDGDVIPDSEVVESVTGEFLDKCLVIVLNHPKASRLVYGNLKIL